VKIEGMMLALLDIPAEYTEEYNRWYDLDHMPEHVAKPDVLMGQRYVAPRALRGAAGVIESKQVGGYPPYLTTYWFGGPLDMSSDQAREGWLSLDRRIVKAGRFWRPGRSRHNSRWRVTAAHTRPGCLVHQDAVPYLAHRGVIVALGQSASPDRLQEAVDWWEQVRLNDLFTVVGLLGAIRMEPATDEQSDLMLHILLCEDSPAMVMHDIEQKKKYWGAVGRFPAHAGVYQDVAFMPYQRIIPLEYDFDIGEADA
jgi:hypothetical protein